MIISIVINWDFIFNLIGGHTEIYKINQAKSQPSPALSNNNSVSVLQSVCTSIFQTGFDFLVAV